MKKRPLPLYLSLILCSGCATWERTFFAKDLARLSAGMSKQESISAIGDPQEIVMAKQTEKGLFEVFEYVEKPAFSGRLNSSFWTSYWVYFMDGKLAGYEKADAVNARKRLERAQLDAELLGGMNAMKGTSLMPTEQNVNFHGSVDVNHSGTIKVHSY